MTTTTDERTVKSPIPGLGKLRLDELNALSRRTTDAVLRHIGVPVAAAKSGSRFQSGI